MKKTLQYGIAAALVTGVMGFTAARATITMNWQQPQTISGDSDVVTNGAPVTAWNAGNNDGLITTVNGVPFADHWSNQSSGNTSLTGGANAIGFCNGTIGSANYTALIAAATYLDTSVQVTGLVPGLPYLFEWWANDNRGSIVAGRQAIATVGLNSVTLQENSGPSSTGFGQFVVGKFVADATGTLTVNFTGNPSGDGILNAFQLREIPEPSSSALAILAGGCWLAGRRRKLSATKPSRRPRFLPFACLAMASLFFGVAGTARAVTVTSASGPDGTFSVSGADLINTGQVSYLGISMPTGSPLFGSSLDQLNNGVIYTNPSGLFLSAECLVPSDGSVVVVTLNTNKYPTGLDITNVVSLTDYSGTTRTGQKYDLAVHYAGAPAGVFTPIASVDVLPSANFEQQVIIAGDNGGILAAGVDQLQFTFHNDSGVNHYADVYREIDVFGVPEPSTAWMALLAGGGLLAGRRNRRSGRA